MNVLLSWLQSQTIYAQIQTLPFLPPVFGPPNPHHLTTITFAHFHSNWLPLIGISDLLSSLGLWKDSSIKNYAYFLTPISCSQSKSSPLEVDICLSPWAHIYICLFPLGSLNASWSALFIACTCFINCTLTHSGSDSCKPFGFDGVNKTSQYGDE